MTDLGGAKVAKDHLGRDTRTVTVGLHGFSVASSEKKGPLRSPVSMSEVCLGFAGLATAVSPRESSGQKSQVLLGAQPVLVVNEVCACRDRAACYFPIFMWRSTCFSGKTMAILH
jgi:hypothetical protein